ncbi:hypothetical protein AQUCO_07800011v1 [Aquilegia coerulea]|uniref:Uncharacterized protein n=1 Tax=Aquilegia coerulea TaxID=218851 RepID=A0A2G5C7W4_AQUCA|nr:hypothetical protein AQUCO_07800011v1 [Aquilegia coerulea]
MFKEEEDVEGQEENDEDDEKVFVEEQTTKPHSASEVIGSKSGQKEIRWRAKDLEDLGPFCNTAYEKELFFTNEYMEFELGNIKKTVVVDIGLLLWGTNIGRIMLFQIKCTSKGLKRGCKRDWQVKTYTCMKKFHY